MFAMINDKNQFSNKHNQKIKEILKLKPFPSFIMTRQKMNFSAS